MFNSITGKITEKHGDYFCLENSGLEWRVETTAQTLSTLPETGERMRIFLYLYHKEDMMKLYGFSTEQERSVFLDLLKVNGVGPKAALKILSGLPAEEFVSSLEREDVGSLSRIPGLGEKTARKIILQLKGKLKMPGDIAESPTDRSGEIAESLTAMGFDKKEVKKVLTQILADSESRELLESGREQEIMRRAIMALSR